MINQRYSYLGSDPHVITLLRQQYYTATANLTHHMITILQGLTHSIYTAFLPMLQSVLCRGKRESCGALPRRHYGRPPIPEPSPPDLKPSKSNNSHNHTPMLCCNLLATLSSDVERRKSRKCSISRSCLQVWMLAKPCCKMIVRVLQISICKGEGTMSPPCSVVN